MNIGELTKFRGGIATDTISEQTSASGVTIDGVLLKDNKVTASGGITFGDETLANYDEGTWNPTVNFTSGSYTVQIGRYTRFGNIVTASFHILYNISTAGTGELQISIPITAKTSTSASWNGVVGCCTGASYSGERPACYIDSGGSVLALEKLDATNIQREAFSTGFVRIQGTITYEV